MPLDINKLYISTALKHCFGTGFLQNPESTQFLKGISDFGNERKLKTNEIISLNDPAPTYLICTSGLLMLEQTSDTQERHVFGFIFPGTLLGAPDNPGESFQLKALTDSECIELNKHKMQALFQKHPHISRLFLDVAEQTIHYFLRLAVTLGKRSAVQRLADFLLQYQRCSGADAQLYLPMSRRDISCLLGLSEETTSRAFSKLKSVGAIDIKSRYFIQILDSSLLSLQQQLPITNNE